MLHAALSFYGFSNVARHLKALIRFEKCVFYTKGGIVRCFVKSSLRSLVPQLSSQAFTSASAIVLSDLTDSKASSVSSQRDCSSDCLLIIFLIAYLIDSMLWTSP